MNGPQDMGGMQCYGPVAPEPGEPLFHAPWEARALAVTVAAGATGLWTIDQSRAARESLPPALYLSSSYYAIWIEALERLLRARGWADGTGERMPAKRVPDAAAMTAILARGAPAEREATAPARFAVGDRVRTRNHQPATHTRLPAYARDRDGVVEAVRGVHVLPDGLPDAHAPGEGKAAGEAAQWLYTVRFAARDLFGARADARDSVSVDCWESYLEHD